MLAPWLHRLSYPECVRSGATSFGLLVSEIVSDSFLTYSYLCPSMGFAHENLWVPPTLPFEYCIWGTCKRAKGRVTLEE